MFALTVETDNIYSISISYWSQIMERKPFLQLLAQLESLTHLQKQKLLSQINENSEKKSVSLIESSFNDAKFCPHCQSFEISRWGKSHDLQRFRCKNCKKTFNALTGTSLSRLRYKELWLQYSQCLHDGETVRKAAEVCGIDNTTSFRWRHRFLNRSTENKQAKMTGIVEADETFFTESSKGNRRITERKARKRGKSAKKLKGERVPVLIVRDRSGTVADFVFNELSKKEVHDSLRPLMDKEVVLCSDGNSFYQTFAKQENIPHKRIISLDKEYVVDKIFHIQNLNAYISRLKSWMIRFNGVATKYLSNYLAWRKVLESKDGENVNEYIKQCILRKSDQHLTQT